TNIAFGNLSTYENTTFGLKIRYPSDWVLKPGRGVNPSLEIVAVLSPGTDDDSAFTIAIQKLEGPDTTVGDYANNTMNSYKQGIDNFQLTLFNTNTKLSGSHAYEIDGTYVDNRSVKREFFEVGTVL